MDKRFFVLFFLLVSFVNPIDSFADDAATQAEIKSLKQTVAELTDRIADLEASLNRSGVCEDFAWDVVGTRLQECDPAVIENLNAANGTRYRGAVVVTNVRRDSPASNAGIKNGDLLLGIDRWQTTDLHDLKLIANKHKRFASTGKTKFYVARNGEAFFGYLDLPKP